MNINALRRFNSNLTRQVRARARRSGSAPATSERRARGSPPPRASRQATTADRALALQHSDHAVVAPRRVVARSVSGARCVPPGGHRALARMRHGAVRLKTVGQPRVCLRARSGRLVACGRWNVARSCSGSR